MATQSFSIPNISCGHCVMSIKNELGDLPGIKKVEGSPEKKQITVVFEPPATLDSIRNTLKEMNYPAV